MSSAPRDLRLLVLPVVAISNLDENDREYSGVYRAEVPANLTDSQMYLSLVDSFHRTRALRRPDDFSYYVWEDDRQIEATAAAAADANVTQFIPLIKEVRAAIS